MPDERSLGALRSAAAGCRGCPGAMMAARTAVTQLGYLLGATVGGALIAGAGYGALGLALAGGLALSAVLVLRVDDPLDG